MKRYFLFMLAVLFFFNIAGAQTGTVNGTVKDKQNNALHYAFIQDKASKKGTYSDSLGNFSLVLNGAGQLTVTCTGFRDTVVSTDGKSPLSIVLSIKGNGQSAAVAVDAAHNTLRDQMNMDAAGYRELASAGSLVPMVHIKEATKGSRLFATDWLHGYIINDQDQLVQSPDFLLNYDKITGDLLLTKDKSSMISVNKESAKSFTLYNNGQNYTFELIPKVDNTRFAVVLASGTKYKICKLIRTKFVAANYQTNGLSSTGNNYDEYVDEPAYYVIDVKADQVMKLSLKKKSIKEDFAKEADKVNKFISSNSGDIDDAYLSNLGAYMNQ
jgi:hypothetical protein